jgi:hypothetical protein
MKDFLIYLGMNLLGAVIFVMAFVSFIYFYWR